MPAISSVTAVSCVPGSRRIMLNNWQYLLQPVIHGAILIKSLPQNSTRIQEVSIEHLKFEIR